MAGTIRIFGQEMPKTAVYAVGGVVALAVGIAWYRSRHAAAGSSTPTASDQSATDSSAAVDPTASYPYDTGGYGGGGGSGYYTTSTPPASSSTPVAFSSNGQWAQAAEAYIVANTGGDPATIGQALGYYLTGQPVTSAQDVIIEEAIAAEGLPPEGGPNGYPPSINTGNGAASSSGPASSASSASSAGAGTSGTAANWTFTPPNEIGITKLNATSIRVHWNAVTGPQGQKPTGYTLVLYRGGDRIRDNTVTGLSYQENGLAKGGTITAEVWANGAPTAPPHASATVTL